MALVPEAKKNGKFPRPSLAQYLARNDVLTSVSSSFTSILRPNGRRKNVFQFNSRFLKLITVVPFHVVLDDITRPGVACTLTQVLIPNYEYVLISTVGKGSKKLVDLLNRVITLLSQDLPHTLCWSSSLLFFSCIGSS